MNQNNTDPGRNRPTEEGRDNDPNLRDESAAQPGVNTMSSSDTDSYNEDLTKTVSDNDDRLDYEGLQEDDHADPNFDDIDGDDSDE